MAIYTLPRPVACNACGLTWQTGTIGQGAIEPGAVVVCIGCAHLNALGPDWQLWDLSPDEAREVREHPNFPNIRAMQEKVIQEQRLIG